MRTHAFIAIRRAALTTTTALQLALASLLVTGAVSLVPDASFAQTPGASAAATTSQPPLKAEEIDQLVAPIALYPDTLLSEVLMASTYPLEVVEADRWVKQNKSLKSDALAQAVEKQQWDDSVKSLTAVPDVLAMMSSKLDWTQKLGDAVLAQQADVMDAVQRLRRQAQANNKLQTTKEQKVTVTQQSGQDYIVIEPATPNTVYVPYYDPAVVYGAWAYPDYPPYYFQPPGYVASAAIATGVAFASGVAIGAWAANDGWWRGGFGWHDNVINVRNTDININTANNKAWVHNPDHRHGVRYTNNDVRQKFAKGDARGADRRMDFRGHDGQQVLRPDGDRTTGRGPDLNRKDGSRPDMKRPDAKRDAKGAGGANRTADRAHDHAKGAKQASGGKHQAQKRPSAAHSQARPRPARHEGAFAHVDRGGLAQAHAARGRASFGGHAGGFHGGGMRGGGGFHGGGHRR